MIWRIKNLHNTSIPKDNKDSKNNIDVYDDYHNDFVLE
jgi:hypothetical protein